MECQSRIQLTLQASLVHSAELGSGLGTAVAGAAKALGLLSHVRDNGLLLDDNPLELSLYAAFSTLQFQKIKARLKN